MRGIRMQYTEGKFGRVFQVRVNHGEDLLESVQTFVREKDIWCGFAQFIGALEGGRIVTGPKELVLPPDPSFQSYEGGWEVFGFATITPGPDCPHLHYHASIGNNREVMTGCLRERATVYIVVEVLIIELTGSTVTRKKDPVTGMNLPFFGNPPADTGR
jgi:hypothetical protein